jgi:CubicO group peptidase (beta-lactamase class C family)
MPQASIARILVPALAVSALGATLVAMPSHAAPLTKAKPTPQLEPVKAPVVSVQKAKTHKFRPVVEGRTLAEQVDVAPAIKLRKLPKFDIKPKLDSAAFAEDLHNALKDKVRGYSMQLRRNGAPEITLIWEWAKSPEQGAKGWDLDTRMHVASVSKLMTAIVITDLLDQKGLSVDTKIGPYIPGYWSVGTNVADITFRDLLTHRSGFATNGSDGGLPVMKAEIAGSVPASPGYKYENVNFSICRVLGAVMAGAIDKNQQFPIINDAAWDIVTTDWFLERAQTHVFTPSGVSNVSAAPAGKTAFAYQSKSDKQGWNSGDLATQLGGAGFRMSVNDLLSVMGTFRRAGSIVSKAEAQEAIDAMLGLDQMFDTPAGKIYNKNGAWGDGAGNLEQSVVFFLPENMEVAVLVNSPIGSTSESLRETVRIAYMNNLK